jgi:hypothetical protein
MALPVAHLDSGDPHAVLRRISAAIFVLALLLRLLILAAHPRPLQSDEIDYDQLGWNLASTGRYSVDGHPTAYRAIGYPASIAGIYAIAGRNPTAVKVVQAVLDSGTAVLLFLLFARRNRRAGILAGVTWALLPAAILFSSQLFSESLLVFALVLFVYLADVETVSLRRAQLVGLYLGGLILIKPLVIALFAIAAPFVILARNPVRRATMLAFAVVPVALWVLRNTLVIGAPVLTTSVGVNLFIGNNPRATGSYAPVDPAVAPPSGDTELANDAAAGRAALESIARAPLTALTRAIRKVIFLFTSEGELVVGNFAGESGAAGYRDRYRSVPPWIHLLVSLPTALLMILGTLGLATRRPDLLGRIFYLLLFATVLSCVLFFGGSRFRFPLLALLSGFAAEFVVERRERVLGFTRRRLAVSAAVAAGVIVVWVGEVALIGIPH